MRSNGEGVLALVLLWIPFSSITRIVGESWHLNRIILIALVSVVHFAVLTTFVQLLPACTLLLSCPRSMNASIN